MSIVPSNNPGQQQLYQRAVTPTVQTLNINIPQHQHHQSQQVITDRDNNSSSVKGKVLSYGTNQQTNLHQATNMNTNTSGIAKGFVQQPPNAVNIALTVKSPRSMAAAASNNGSSRTNNRQSQSSAFPMNSLETASVVSSSLPQSPHSQQLAPAPEPSSTYVPPRYDLVPFVQGIGIEPAAAISEEISVPADGIIFARIRGHPESLVVFRTPEERLKNPERLNLDRRQLEICPVLEQEQRLRLLNFQNNNIRLIQNLENLPNLIFLDLYNNKITTLEGSVSSVKGLRVLMAGKNKIGVLSNLTQLRKLDVLDLHSNEIKVIEGLDNLADLRVLNLAGNRISLVSSLSSLASLTELNLRRNFIERVSGLERLPMLQRVFLSHNLISALGDVDCLFQVRFLIELSLDGNPVSSKDAVTYRNAVILGIPGLRHLDLKRITEDERVAAAAALSSRQNGGQFQTYKDPAAGDAKSKVSGIIAPTQHRPGSALDGRGFGSVESLARDVAGLGLGELRTSEAIDMDMYSISSTLNKPINAGRHSEYDISRPSDVATKGLEHGSGPREGAGGDTSKYGKLSANDVFIGFDVTSAQEKAMVVSGEVSMADWMQARRQMATVTELALLHMPYSAIVSKLTAVNLAAGAQSAESGGNMNILFPAAKTVRFMFNEFHSIRNVDFIPEWFSSTVEHVVIRDNPICAASSNLVRSYLIASMPLLRFFNDEAVSPAERFAAERQFRPLLDTLASTRTQATQLLSKTSLPQRASSSLLPQPQQLHLQLQLLLGQQQPRPKAAAAAAASHSHAYDGRGKVAATQQASDGNNFSDVFEKVVTKIILDTLNTIRPSTT